MRYKIELAYEGTLFGGWQVQNNAITVQGEIDKETQKLKNEGSKELAKVQSQGSIYNSLVGSFNF